MSNIQLHEDMTIETKSVLLEEVQAGDHVVGDDLIYEVTDVTTNPRGTAVWSQSDQRAVTGRVENLPDVLRQWERLDVITVVR
ncbi:hypothetical protein [Saccharopolyspora sp. 6V]|uniref:hypothetical protein n=1 Tax=Saccharopolyspora sp. 6V TaxID=2877239 RepID=UPI001CD4EA30|nr:hypothetical protein [Saccharopolyspora sp. 6V]MCA1191648.1 hypothetical protein [Saccharopolyspora sp. 6V]